MPPPAPAPLAKRKTAPRSKKKDGGNGGVAPPGTPPFLMSPEEALRDGERRGQESDFSTEQSQWSDAADFEEDTRTCLEGEEPPGPLAEDAGTLACEARHDLGEAPISSEEPEAGPESEPDVSVDDSFVGPLADEGAPEGEEVPPVEGEGEEPLDEGDTTTGGEGEETGGDETDGEGGAGGGGPKGRPAAVEADLAGMESMGGGELDLIDTELAEHQRWAGALAEVGTAGSADRAGFVLKQIGEGFATGLAGGAGMGLGIGLLHRGLNSQLAARAAAPLAARMGGSALARTGDASKAAAKMAARFGTKLGPKVAAQCAKFTPLPAIGAVIGGVISFHSLYTRDWSQTAETISNIGEGEGYEFLANSIAAISEIIDVVSNGLNVIAGLMGIVTLALWVGAVLSAGALAPLAGTLTALSLAIGAVTLALDAINMIVLQPSVTLFRALHTFTSDSDPREVSADGKTLSAAAAANGGALGGLAGAHASNLGGAKPKPKAPESTKLGDNTPPPAGGEGPRVDFEAQPKPPELPPAPAAAEGGASPHPAETPSGAPPPADAPSPAPALPAPPESHPATTPSAPDAPKPAVPADVPATPAATPDTGAPPSAAPEVPAAAPPPKPPKPAKPAKPKAAPPPGAPPAPSPDHTWVPGHTKKDGTAVAGHWRGPPGAPTPKPAKPAKAAPPPGAPPAPSPDHTWVPGHTRKDGTVVAGHWRAPAGSPKPAKPKATPPPGAPPAPSPNHTWVPGHTRADGTVVAGHWRAPAGTPKPPKPPKPPKAPPPSGGPPLTPAQIADEVARAGRRARQSSIRRQGRKTATDNLRESVESGIYDPQSANTVEDLGPGRVDDFLSPKEEGEPHPGSRAEGIKTSIEFSDLPRLADMPLEPQSGGKSFLTSFEEHREGHHEGNTQLPIELAEPRRPDWDVTLEPAREFTPDPDQALSSALDPDAPMESGFEESKGWQTSELELPTDIFSDPENPHLAAAYAKFKAQQSGGGTPPATPAPAPGGTTQAAAETTSIPTEPIPEPSAPQGPPEPDTPPPPPAGGPEPGPESPPPAPTLPPDVTPETPSVPETPSTPPAPDVPPPTPESDTAAPPAGAPPLGPRVPSEKFVGTTAAEAVSRTASTREIATQSATAAESGRVPPDQSPSVGRLFFPMFYAGEHGPSPAEQQATFNAQFAADFPPVQGVERANPAYPQPPCTPAQIEAIRGHIAELRQARAQATHAEGQMDAELATHTANEGPLAETVATTEAGIESTEQHAEKTQCTADANAGQQERQIEVAENVSHYSEHESAIDGLRTPARAFQGMMDLASYLPGDAGEAMDGMNRDATQMLSAFDEMDASMAAQETEGGVCTAKLEDDGAQIEATATEGEATLEQLTTAQTDATVLEEQNTCAVEEATENRSAAEMAGGEIDSKIDEQESKAESLAQQLQSWAEAHRAARMTALSETQKKVKDNDLAETAVHTE